MVTYTFPSYPAIDPTTETLVRNASGQVYDINDTSGTTPLAVTDLNGLPLSAIKTTDQGITDAFRVEDKPEVIWRSGSYAIPLSSPKAMRDAAEGALAAAQSAATDATEAAEAAETTADEVQSLRRWVDLGVTRRNFALNPRAISGGSAWSLSANGLTATQTFLTGLTTAIPGVTTATRFTVTAVTSDSSMFLVPQATVTGTGTTVPVLPGQRVSAGMLAWASWGAGGVRVYIQFRAAESAILASTNSGLIPVSSTGGGTWVTHTAVAPEGSVYATVLVGTNADRTEAVGDWIQGTAAISAVDDVVTLATGDWFDGSIKPTTNRGYRWSGPENASVSEMIDMSVIWKDATEAAEAAQTAAEQAASSAATVLPAGGSTGQALVKLSNADRNVGWATVSGGGGSAVTSVAGKTGAVSLVKADVGLAQVDNTSDVDKPVSTAQAAAIAAKANLSHTHSVSQVTGLQAALDSKAGVNAPVNASQVNAGTGTINPARLGSGTPSGTSFLRGDGTWATPPGGGSGGAVNSVNGQTGDVTLDAADVGALPDTYTAPVVQVAGKTGVVTLAKGDVGLGAVDNTADADKPVSGPQQSALDAKQDAASAVRTTGNQSIGGVKTFTSAPVVPDASFAQAKVSGLPAALASKVSSTTISEIWTGSQSAYDAIEPKNPTTLYLITGG